jgi:crotonobetainyl-CoA:carnitine CoA-transferase CaiB-like acyl-CoA transferase
MHTVDAIMLELESWCAAHDMAQIMTAMAAARVPAGPILRMSDILKEPQYLERCVHACSHHAFSGMLA